MIRHIRLTLTGSSTICDGDFSPSRKHSSIESLVESPRPRKSLAFNDSLCNCIDVLLANYINTINDV
jgi:hypothetical protein